MRERTLAAALLFAAALAARPVRAALILPPSIAQRVATADAVVVGKVTGIDEKTITAERFPGQKAEFRIATVKIEDGILGTRGLTHLKVGFVPPVAPRPGELRPGGGIGPYRNLAVKLEKGQEVCLFLKAHPREAFYVAPAFYDAIDKKAPGFDNDVAEARRFAKLLADPAAGLKSRSAQERFETAALLVYRYRAVKHGARQEPIDAAQSRLILEALADADWNVRPGVRPGGQPRQTLTPQGVFFALGLQATDGWMPPPGQPFADVARTWLKTNAGIYRIRRYAPTAEK